MNRVVCVECEEEMKPEENGVDVSELGGDGKPYKMWKADALRCPGCGTYVVTGFADNPFMQRPDERLRAASLLAMLRF